MIKGIEMLIVKKNGMVQGGECYVTYSEEIGKVHVWGFVQLKIAFLKKKINFNESKTVPKEWMISDNIKTDQTYGLDGGGIVHVDFVANGTAFTRLSTKDCSGTIDFDLKQKYIDPIALNVTVKYLGMKANIQAYRARENG